MIGTVRRLALFEALRALGTWRWVLVIPILFLSGYLEAGQVTYDPDSSTPLILNFWDVPLSMMVNSFTVLFVFGLGFTFVTGDLYARDLSAGTAPMTLLRSRSRRAWWAAKISALGILALVYSTLALGLALAAGALEFPISLQASPASQEPWWTPEGLYPGSGWLPQPLLFVFVVLYTALALWAVGALVLATSALYPSSLVPLIVCFVWAILDSNLISPLYARIWPGTLDPMYHLSYVVHFDAPRFDSTSWLTSLVVIALCLVAATLFGAWKLRRTDM